mmetsp:Transcript_26202/g.51444  ORF Transcript_26202/g.51444 Transcript_26202/m.51444 type:complete len:106 (-) Transcript_26202:2055-2372(-)
MVTCGLVCLGWVTAQLADVPIDFRTTKKERKKETDSLRGLGVVEEADGRQCRGCTRWEIDREKRRRQEHRQENRFMETALCKGKGKKNKKEAYKQRKKREGRRNE